MIIKVIKDEDFDNYKKPSMVIGFPKCNFKCDIECGEQVCQNGALALSQNINIPIKEIVTRYCDNNLTSAIVFGGLEPMDSAEILQLVSCFRGVTEDDIVIFTGYYKEEICDILDHLKEYKNIIVKFGRYIPKKMEHFDNVLGVFLASDNQYAERIS